MVTGRRIAMPILAILLITVALAITPAVPRVLAGTNGVATDDFYVTREDVPLTVAAPGVLANDYPPDSCVIESDTFELTGSIGSGVGFSGGFIFTPARDFNGATRFTYVMGQNSGGCPAGQADTGEVFITVTAVNDPPRVVRGPDCPTSITVKAGSAQFTGQHCVEMRDFGPVDENNQSFDAWLVSTDRPELFSKKPAVVQVDGLFGRLRFTPAGGASGTATISIRGRDSGGTANQGKNTSAAVTVKVVITALPTAEPTLEPTEVPTAEPTLEPTNPPTLEPTAAVIETGSSSPEPSGAPSPSAGGGPSGAVLLLAGVLAVLVVGFVAALLYPRLGARRS